MHLPCLSGMTAGVPTLMLCCTHISDHQSNQQHLQVMTPAEDKQMRTDHDNDGAVVGVSLTAAGLVAKRTLW